MGVALNNCPCRTFDDHVLLVVGLVLSSALIHSLHASLGGDDVISDDPLAPKPAASSSDTLAYAQLRDDKEKLDRELSRIKGDYEKSIKVILTRCPEIVDPTIYTRAASTHIGPIMTLPKLLFTLNVKSRC